jgi:epsilon-lactone hydrolase
VIEVAAKICDLAAHFAVMPRAGDELPDTAQHSIGEAIDDCYDGHWWSRGQGYRPHQIVLTGDPPDATCHSPWPNGC